MLGLHLQMLAVRDWMRWLGCMVWIDRNENVQKLREYDRDNEQEKL